MKNFASIYKLADDAGKAAAETCSPVPMIVSWSKNGVPQKEYVADGVCGFAWVQFAGNTAWGRWAKKMGYARPSYPKGLSIWVSDYNQSMQRKEAYARAFANVLKNSGIDAYAQSRMD